MERMGREPIWRKRSVGGALVVGVVGLLANCQPDDAGFGTPGGNSEESTDSVIFSEVMANPDGGGKVQDKAGEWIELYNAGTSDVDLTGWTLSDSDGSSITLGELTVKARAFVVIGSSNKNAENGGVSVDGTWDPESLTLGNEAESLELRTAEGGVADTLTWTAAPSGASLSVDPSKYSAENNDIVGATCASKYSMLESGDYGTPGALNDYCSLTANIHVGDLVITEIMANPSAVLDVEGEWIEVFNTTADSIRLDGLRVEDGAGDKHDIASGGSLIVAPRSYVVLGASAVKADNGGVDVDYAWGKAIILDDSAGKILLAMDKTTLDSVSYGSTGFPSTPAGASLQLDKGEYSASGNDAGEVWCGSEETISGGSDKGSPGSGNSLCVEATPTPSPTPTGP